MRSTITLDPHVAQLLEEEVRERDITFKEAVNSAIRAGIKGSSAKRPRFRQQTFAMGPPAPGFNWDKALQIASQLEDDEIMRKMAAPK
jgi:hypothetical protein